MVAGSVSHIVAGIMIRPDETPLAEPISIRCIVILSQEEPGHITMCRRLMRPMFVMCLCAKMHTGRSTGTRQCRPGVLCDINNAMQRKEHPTPDRDRLSLPLLEGPPLMDPLDVTHGVLRCWRAGIWGGLDAGAPARFRTLLGLSVSLLFRRAASTPGALPVWNPAPSGGRAP